MFKVVIGFLFTSVFLVGCATQRKSPKNISVPPDLAKEYSLKSDRQSLKEARKDVPQEVQQENDELAFILGLMKDGKEDPSKVRSRFQKISRKKRQGFRKAQRKLRDTFKRNEKKQRKSFLKEIKKERDDFTAQSRKKRMDREARSEFFSENDEKRRLYFAEERDARREFESELRSQSKDFEDSMRAQSKLFYQELREYSKTYRERKKAERLQRQRPRSQPRSSSELDIIDQVQGKPLIEN